jgi:DNA-binding transcriptional ArsR family regulator
MQDPFEAIAEPNRRRILDLLTKGEAPAGALGAALRLSQPGASKHLRVLRNAGLVRVRSDGRQRLYALHPEALAEVDAWLAPYRSFWASRLDALDAHLKEEN